MNELVDTFGRRVTSLRISVTDRCNFRCRYCMPEEGMEWLNRGQLLTFEEITRFVRVISSLGVSKIRLTGGEPLMRRELWKLIGMIREVPGIRDIALTTNGYFLREQAARLVGAGLDRLNISLDSLDPTTFNEMARRNHFNRVMEGIREAESLGVSPIKLNVVLIRGINDGEIADFARLARSNGYVIRFIEFMPIGKDDEWTNDKVVPTHEVLEEINKVAPLIPIPVNGVKAPAARYVFRDGKGEIGFISSVSDPFCGDCDRVRLTSDGKFRTCLFALEETDIRSLLRNGASDEEIARVLADAVMKKKEGHLINRPGFVRPERTMSQIGG